MESMTGGPAYGPCTRPGQQHSPHSYSPPTHIPPPHTYPPPHRAPSPTRGPPSPAREKLFQRASPPPPPRATSPVRAALPAFVSPARLPGPVESIPVFVEPARLPRPLLKADTGYFHPISQPSAAPSAPHNLNDMQEDPILYPHSPACSPCTQTPFCAQPLLIIARRLSTFLGAGALSASPGASRHSHRSAQTRLCGRVDAQRHATVGNDKTSCSTRR